MTATITVTRPDGETMTRVLPCWLDAHRAAELFIQYTDQRTYMAVCVSDEHRYETYNTLTQKINYGEVTEVQTP